MTILPEPQAYSASLLPSLWAAEPRDVYAISVEKHEGSRRVGGGGPGGAAGAPPYPFQRDLLATEHHLRCGNAIVHRSSSLEDVTGFGQVHVVNLGSYYWSSTLKDPRSWAIINTALENGITDLAVWTAGNAGLSLAKMAYIANRRLPRERRLQIHAIVDINVAPEIRTRLRMWQCEVLDIFRRDKPVLNPDEIKGLVTARLKRSRRQLQDASYWDVTDGWDGVGLLMYRFISAQIVRDMAAAVEPAVSAHNPLSIVLPVGTGNLLLGFYLGVQDCERAGLIEPGSCKIVGAIPAGANIVANIRQRKIPETIDEPQVHPHAATQPIMPKLASSHTPLAPCLAKLDQERLVHFVVVTEHDQMRAAKHVLPAGIDDGLACEPSALATFAALPHVYTQLRSRQGEDRSWKYQSQRRLLVVNSGLGILGHDEEEVLRRATGE
ncbi:MAG: pyridoxal-phosphate dependent enzyme [Minicystis sp.]